MGDESADTRRSLPHGEKGAWGQPLFSVAPAAGPVDHELAGAKAVRRVELQQPPHEGLGYLLSGWKIPGLWLRKIDDCGYYYHGKFRFCVYGKF